MKVFIISYNRLTPLKAMCEWIVQTGHEPVIIDNCSTYRPLLNWYFINVSKIDLYPFEENRGHLVLWKYLSGLLTDKYYCVTDPDLDLSQIPHDWADVLKQGLIDNPDVIKAGFSLRIDDLPENEYTKEVIKWEQKYWEREKRGNFFLSEIDTTFAMYDRDRDFDKLPNDRFFSAVRADKPYCCRHTPWYNTKENLTDEEKYYMEHSHGYWTEKFKELA